MKTKLLKPVLLTVLALFIISANQFFSQSKDDIVLGSTFKVKSQVLNEERNMQVYLPDSYNLTQTKYPVVYLLDGESHFIYAAGLLQFLARNNRAPEMILVGIPNTFRNRDFTPRVDSSIAGTGGGDNFLKCLKEEIIPAVEEKYRTIPYRILIGHSLTGMFCFYTLMNEPDLFNSFIAISPWVINNKNFIIEYTKEKLSKFSSLKKEIYFTAGSLEQPDLLSALEKLGEIFKTKAPNDFVWNYKLMQNEDHNSQVLLAMYDGFNRIFNGWNLPNEIATKGIKAVVSHFGKLSEKFGFQVEPQEATMNAMGYYFLQGQNFDEAIEFFKKNVELYPSSANVYDSLGEAYETTSNYDLALKNYDKAFTIAKTLKNANLPIYQKNYERMKEKVKN